MKSFGFPMKALVVTMNNINWKSSPTKVTGFGKLSFWQIIENVLQAFNIMRKVDLFEDPIVLTEREKP